MNAGGLYGEARPENFPMVNDYRNPIIAEAMKQMKYVNMFNQGVKRVQNLLKQNGNKEADFDVSKLTVFCVNVFSNEENESQNDTQNDTQNLSSLQKDILRLISTNNQITGTELAKKLGKSLTTIRRAIRGISFLKYEGPSKGGHWIIDE